MSNTAGYVLLGSASFPAVLGWDLSRRGLNKVTTATDKVAEAAKATKDVVKEAHTALAEAQPGQSAVVAAQKASEVVEKTDDLTTGINDVSSALKEMTGVFAPARVFMALVFLLVLGALVALDVIVLGGSS